MGYIALVPDHCLSIYFLMVFTFVFFVLDFEKSDI